MESGGSFYWIRRSMCAVCTGESNPSVAVMKSAQEGASHSHRMRQVLGKPSPDRPILAIELGDDAPRKALAIGRIVVGGRRPIAHFMKSRRGILGVGARIAGISLR